MKKRIFALLMVLVMAFALVGCGDSEEEYVSGNESFVKEIEVKEITVKPITITGADNMKTYKGGFSEWISAHIK